MQHVILIICHERTNALESTLEMVSTSKNTKAYIHVDKKVSLENFGFIHEYDNCELLLERSVVNWGDYSQIKCMVKLLDYINNNVAFDYVSVISGDDFLYRGLEKFNSFLLKNKGCEFIGTTSLSGVDNRHIKRYLHYYPHWFFFRQKSLYLKVAKKIYSYMISLGLFRNKIERPFPIMYKGSNWFTITKKCNSYILGFVKSNPSYGDFFKSSFCCDEVFFQSIIFNSEFKVITNIYLNSDLDDNEASLRQIDWETGPEYPKVYSLNNILKIKPLNTFILRKVNKSISVKQLLEISGEYD
jgi:hypothetical protein